MNIGSRVEMFVDHFLIEDMEGCSLKLNKPVRREKVITFDRPWESETSGYVTIIPGGSGYLMYYRGRTDHTGGKPEELTCVAESTDGIVFERPGIGLYEYNGSLVNNIILKDVPECHNFTPFADPSGKYMAVGGHERFDDDSACLRALESRDGMEWHRVSDEPILTDGMFDSQNVAFFDRNIGKYRCYYRYFDKKDTEGTGAYEGIRAIKSSVSPDFLNWEPGIANSYDVPFLEQFYTNATVCCPGAEHIYLSFPKRFIPERKRDFYTDSPGVSDAVFMTSRDGTNWNRTFMEAWARPGTDRRNWVNRNNMPCLGIVETSSDEFSMYISENYRSPSNGIRRLSIRKHGFASVNAGFEEGTLVTKPLAFSGSRLMLNYSTSAAGHVSVEILDEDYGQLAASGNFYGDEISEEVDFGKSLKMYEGREIRLCFRLADADIYAFGFTEDE